MTTEEPAGLRERKKQQTRDALLEISAQLFEERGYENVTVAEIANLANISVKTFFTYFRSKEDLAFADQQALLGRILDVIRVRSGEVSPADAVRGLLVDMISTGEAGLDGVEGYHRLVGESQTLQSRLRRMWEEYEDEVTLLLKSELRGEDAPIRARIVAQELVGMVRLFATPEVLSLAQKEQSGAGQRQALERWAEVAAELVRDGIGNLDDV